MLLCVETLGENVFKSLNVDCAIKLGDYNIGRKDNLLIMLVYIAFLLTEV